MTSESISFQLLEDILHFGTALRIRVTGKSMAPFILNGETVTLLKDKEYKLGEIVLFSDYHKNLILHRIIHAKCENFSQAIIQTKGDATGCLDPPIAENMILGKVFEIEKTKPLLGHTRIRMDSFFWRVVSRLIVIKTLIRYHKLFAIARPYLTPQIITLYRTLRARLTA